MRGAAGVDLVVLTRGGGEGVQALDDEALIATVAACPVPVAAALVVGRVADAAFPTPTAFGAWLRQSLDQKRAGARWAEGVGGAGREVGQRLERALAALARWAAATTLALLAAALLLGLVLGR